VLLTASLQGEHVGPGVTVRHEAASLAAAQLIMEQYVESAERLNVE